MRVINLFGGPGAGKSTTAAGLFFLMKSRGHKVELITEYAKELTYEKRYTQLSCQLAVTGEQYSRQFRLNGQIDYLITDSPLLLGAIYAKTQWEAEAAMSAFLEFDNENFFIVRSKEYQPYGRRESEESARSVCGKIKHILVYEGFPYWNIPGNENAPEEIYTHLNI